MKKLLLAALLMLLPSATTAADGDLWVTYRSGDWQIYEYLLCDGDHNAGPDTECVEFDIHPKAGIPRYAVVEIRTDDCNTTKAIGRLVGRSVTGASTEYVLTANLQLGSAAAHAIVNPISHRFIRFDISTFGTAVCTDFEVIYRVFYERVSGN